MEVIGVCVVVGFPVVGRRVVDALQGVSYLEIPVKNKTRLLPNSGSGLSVVRILYQLGDGERTVGIGRASSGHDL